MPKTNAPAKGTRPSLLEVVVRPFQAFIKLEASSGILLLLCAVAALVWANVHPASYRATFDYEISLRAAGAAASFSLRELVNDGLMTLFFFVVGMEIKGELSVGELNSLAKAGLPAIAALGGIVLPAGIFLAFNWGGPGQHGWGIPMATDIAFCVGILTLLGNRVTRALVVFVTALAIFDDIAGILVIAVFYGHGLEPFWLLGTGVLALLLFGMNRAYVVSGFAYALVGTALWYAVHESGIHATIAGVVLGLMIPARVRTAPTGGARFVAREAPLQRLIHLLHPSVAFLVMPVFALANSGVELRGAGISSLTAPVALGTATGLFFGKQLGIFGAAALAVKLGLAPMPGGGSFSKLYGVSILAGIGFTVALFIAALAFPGAPELLDQAKIGILFGSLAAGAVGFFVLRLSEAKG